MGRRKNKAAKTAMRQAFEDAEYRRMLRAEKEGPLPKNAGTGWIKSGSTPPPSSSRSWSQRRCWCGDRLYPARPHEHYGVAKKALRAYRRTPRRNG